MISETEEGIHGLNPRKCVHKSNPTDFSCEHQEVSFGSYFNLSLVPRHKICLKKLMKEAEAAPVPINGEIKNVTPFYPGCA